MVRLDAIAPEVRRSELLLCAGVPLFGRLAPPSYGLSAVISDAETSGVHASNQGLRPGVAPFRQGPQKSPGARRVQSVVCRYAFLKVTCCSDARGIQEGHQRTGQGPRDNCSATLGREVFLFVSCARLKHFRSAVSAIRGRERVAPRRATSPLRAKNDSIVIAQFKKAILVCPRSSARPGITSAPRRGRAATHPSRSAPSTIADDLWQIGRDELLGERGVGVGPEPAAAWANLRDGGSRAPQHVTWMRAAFFFCGDLL
jgi:hypothetical protein